MDKNIVLIRTVLVHTLFWLLFVVLPPLFVDMSMCAYSSYWLTGVSLMIVFYANFFKIVDITLFQDKKVLFYLINLALIISLTLFSDWWYSKYEDRSDLLRHIGMLIRDISVITLVTALAAALRYSKKFEKIEKERKMMERVVIENELNHLRTQLHPHFLFNTLNNIYALIGFDTDKAQEAVKCLSVLLRYVLYEDRCKGTQRMVKIAQEEEFLSTFVKLMDFRMRPNVKITYRADISKFPDAPCLVLLFISLIENAFTYGVSPTEESIIDILLEVPERDKIHFKLKNKDFSSMQSQKHKVKELTKETHGIGIENTQRRLNLVYGDDAVFNVTKEDGFFTTEIFLNYTERNYYYNVTQENGNTNI